MRRAAALVLLSLPPAGAWAQGVPLGPEFRVNTYTSLAQAFPSAAVDPGGGFVVVWQSQYQDGSSYGVFGQRFAATGAPLGAEFRVNTYTPLFQGEPSVGGMDGSGTFVVVWQSGPGQDGSQGGIFGQRYAASGAPLAGEFRVNTYTTGHQSLPSAAVSLSGSFVVVWRSADGSAYGVLGQRFAVSGVPLGPEFRVNTYTAQAQTPTGVATDAVGNFVVVWQSPQDGSLSGVFGQRYAVSGAPVGPEFQVNTYTLDDQVNAAVDMDGAGNFVVVWQSRGQDGSSDGIFGQRYASTGAPLGGEFRVNTSTPGSQYTPAVATDASGNFVVTWSGYDGSSNGTFGQRFASSGGPLGPEFRVNTFTLANQVVSSVAADGVGRFVVAWRSDIADGSGYGIFAQRYAPILPVELIRFGVD